MPLVRDLNQQVAQNVWTQGLPSARITTGAGSRYGPVGPTTKALRLVGIAVSFLYKVGDASVTITGGNGNYLGPEIPERIGILPGQYIYLISAGDVSLQELG